MLSGPNVVKGMQKSREYPHAFHPFNGVVCSVEDLARLLYNCRKGKNRDQAFRLHSHIYGIGLEDHVLLGNYLVTAYVEAGVIDCAQKVFDRLVLHKEQSWDSLIVGYVKYGKPRGALILYDRMQKLDDVNLSGHAIVALLKALSQLNDQERGAKLILEIERRGLLENNCFVGSALVDMHVKHGSFMKAQEVFERLLVRDVVTWNVLISGLAKCGYGNVALEFYRCMKVEGIFPNAVTFISILKACSAIGSIQLGLDIHAEIERNGLLETDIAIGGTLVSMYAKCGCLVKAQEVFDKLEERDVVSWTALVTGYAEYQYYETAIMCFQQMQLEGVSPDVVTLSWILRACGNIQAQKEGMNVHKFMEEKGITETNLIIGSSLVDMYVKFGMLDKAQQLFENIYTRDVNTWNSVIIGYVENGHGERAINCYEEMKLEGISPDSITFSWVLKACGSLRATENVCNLHAEICSDNSTVEIDVVIATFLIDAYMKCRSLSRAQEVFDKLLIRDVVLWNVLIMGYAENGHGEEALERFERMQYECISPDAVTYLSVCKACGSIGSVEKGEKIHNDIERKGFLKLDLVLGNVLIDMYVHCGSVEKGHQVLNNLCIRDVVSWNTIITGYTEHGLGNDALICFEQMQHEGISPNALTFVSCIKACTCIGDTEKGEEMYAEIRRMGLGSNTVIGTAVVNMYAKFGFLCKAQQTFDALLVQDVTAWNALMNGYEEYGHSDKALKCFEQMQLKGIPLNSMTFACVLKACGMIGDVAKGKEIHSELARKGLLKSELVGNTLLDMYAKWGLFSHAEEVFLKLPLKDVITWTTMIAGYVDCGRGEEALHCFDRMQLDGVVPNFITFLCGLRACSSIGATNKGQEMHADIERKGMLCSNVAISSAVVDLYAKCGLIAVAEQVFNKLAVRVLVTWNALISGYAQAGETECVFNVYNRMREESVEPDPVTFLVILNTCSRAGLFSKYEMYFEAMSKEYGIVPTIEHHNCMVDLLVRMGEVEEALSVSQKIPYFSNLVTSHTLLDACRKCGNIKLGLEAFEHALQIDENDAAAYVLASHIYAISDMERERS